MATQATVNTKEKSKLAKALAPVYFHYDNLSKVARLALYSLAIVGSVGGVGLIFQALFKG